MTETKEHLRAAHSGLLSRAPRKSARPEHAATLQPPRPRAPAARPARSELRAGGRRADGARTSPGHGSIGIAWAIFVATILLLEPAPADPAPAVPLWGELLGLSFFAAFVAALTGLVGGKAWGARASLTAAALGVGVTIACVATGHHTAGAFFGYQLAGFSALGAVSLGRPAGR